MSETYDVTLTVEIRVCAKNADEAAKLARAALAVVPCLDVQDTAHVTSEHETLGHFTETITEDYSDELEMSASPTIYDHDARPDDDNEPGDRCKECGDDVVWMGPSQYDWLHVKDPRNG